jgi:hypothetical protein
LKDRPLIASTRRAGRIREYAMLSLLFIVPLAMRLAATFILPGEPEADGYTHMLEAGGIAERISGGTFELRNLHGNWLPLGKLSCGLLIVVFGHAYWVCRIVSVLAGSAACVLVWAAARRAFDSEFAAWASWFLLLTAPWHLLYSGLGMLEASFGMCIAASVYLLMRSSKDNRLFLVSCMVMGAACLIRYEGWILAPLLWLIGAFQRRASLPVLAAGGLAFTIPVAWWHWLNYVVTGNPFYHLEFGRRYFEDFYRFNPELAQRGIPQALRHIHTLWTAAGPALFVLCCVGLAVMLFRRRIWRDAAPIWLFVVAHVGFLVYSYVTRKAESYTRYWVPALPMMTVAGGFAALACKEWLEKAGTFAKKAVPALAVTWAIAVAAACCLHFALAARGLSEGLRAHIEIASRLRTLYSDGTPRGMIYTDEPAIILHSGIPRRNFMPTFSMPKENAGAVEFLRVNSVEFVVWSDVSYARARAAFPELKTERQTAHFELALDPPGNQTRREHKMPETMLFRVKLK